MADCGPWMPKRLATRAVSSEAGCSEPRIAPSSVISARLDCCARAMVHSSGGRPPPVRRSGRRQRLDQAPQAGASITAAVAFRRRKSRQMTKTVSVRTKSQAIWSRPSTMKAANSPASTPQRRGAIEGAIERPAGQRKPGQAEDLPGMLDAPGRRTAISESQRRHEAAPPRASRDRGNKASSQAAKGQHAEDDGVGLAKARIGIERRQQQEGRREDQGLRIGDLRHAGEDVGRPERRLAAMQRMRQELQLRLKMRLGSHGIVTRRTARARPGSQQPRRRRAASDESKAGRSRMSRPSPAWGRHVRGIEIDNGPPGRASRRGSGRSPASGGRARAVRSHFEAGARSAAILSGLLVMSRTRVTPSCSASRRRNRSGAGRGRSRAPRRRHRCPSPGSAACRRGSCWRGRCRGLPGRDRAGCRRSPWAMQRTVSRSWSPQSHLSEPNRSPVRQAECSRTATGFARSGLPTMIAT